MKRPTVAKGVAVTLDNPTPERWFNVDAFLEPGRFELGTVPRYLSTLRKDALNIADISVSKTFRIGEHLRAQLRGEFLNITNTPRFGLPDSGNQVTLGTGNFGRVLASTVLSRNVQLGLRLLF